MSTHEPVALRRGGLAKAARMCARAFLATPHIAYFFPDSSRREQHAVTLFDMRIRYGLQHGEVLVSSEGMEGIAVWIPSARAGMTMWGQIRAGGMRLYRAVGSDAVARMTHVERHNDRLREQNAPGRYVFLSILAVDPEHQGQGYASQLVQPILRRLDRDRMACYAETTEQDLVAFYQRLGFAACEQSTVPGTNLTVWPMVRRTP